MYNYCDVNLVKRYTFNGISSCLFFFLTAMKCPANSHYEVCSNNCRVACPGLTDVVECPNSCTEGCTCDDGFLFNGQSCVPMTQCGCYENGKTFRVNMRDALIDQTPIMIGRNWQKVA